MTLYAEQVIVIDLRLSLNLWRTSVRGLTLAHDLESIRSMATLHSSVISWYLDKRHPLHPAGETFCFGVGGALVVQSVGAGNLALPKQIK